VLVFLQEGLQLFDLLVLLHQGALHASHHLPLLPQFGNVELVRLELVEYLHVRAILPHPFIFKIA
jgi:hypothetical protein